MGLDLYVGTLTRYYTRNWKTVVQQWAEENGWGFHRVTPDGQAIEPEAEMAADEVRESMESWRASCARCFCPARQLTA